MAQNLKRSEVQSSYLWPVLLIGLGALWMLRVLDIIGNANLAILLRLWPLLLIIVGADLLLRREARPLNYVIVVGGLILVAALVLVGPALGLWQVSVKTFAKTESVAAVTSATITADLAAGQNTVGPASDIQTLFTADMAYLGELSYDATGAENKVIRLENRTSNVSFWDLLSASPHLNIGLSTTVPLSLDLTNGSGNTTLNLTHLKLTSLNVASGSGTVIVNLPASPDPYSATVTGGSGLQNINIPANSSLNLNVTGGSGSSRIAIGNDAAVNLKFQGGSGTLFIDIPDGAAVRVDASAGSGLVTVNGVPCASGSICQRDNGVWESTGYGGAAHQISINASVGSGTISIR